MNRPQSRRFFAVQALAGLSLTAFSFAQTPLAPRPVPGSIPTARPAVAPGTIPGAPAAKPVPTPKDIEKLQKRVKNRKLTDDFFLGPIVRLEIEMEPDKWEALKKSDREYVEATLTETAVDGKKTVYKPVAVKLKGSAGSSQTVDQKPGLTINVTKFKGVDRFHGMKKFHLNNGAQDASMLNEYLSGEMCRAAMVPASRCTHVVVKWQGRDMGIYIFKESFTEDFFSYFYQNPEGNLYDGHFINEIDGTMELQEGTPCDNKDIKALADACKESDPKVRWQKMSELLDVPQFMRFLAMETYVSHWDGYNFNKNNYRVYFDPTTKKASFFCHGMDQTWGMTNWSVLRDPVSLVGSAMLSNPLWKQQYRKVTEEIFTKIISSHEWDNRMERQGKKVQDAIGKWVAPAEGKKFKEQIIGMKDRLKGRVESIGKQFPKPLGSNGTIVPIGPRGWHTDGGGVMDEVDADGQKAYHLKSDGLSPATWKCGIILPAGKYAFQGKVKVTGVDGVPAGGRAVPNAGPPSGEGAGLRVNGASRAGKCEIKGTAGWQPVSFEFETPGGEVVFMAELNSATGDAWFSRNSLTLTKVR